MPPASRSPGYNTLYQLYVREQKTYQEIADRFGVTAKATWKWCRAAGVPGRSHSEATTLQKMGRPWTEAQHAAHRVYRRTPEYRQAAAERQRGEKSNLWRGGKMDDETLRMQGWEWRQRRKECYERDGWLCRDCGVHCTSKGKTKIQAHHIVSRRKGGGDDLANLVTLCISCHHRREHAERREE